MSTFGRTWWGERFLEALERFTDPGRLGRGRTYARGGRVLSYKLEGNTVTAKVRGNINPYFGVYKEPIYTTTVSLKAISAKDWKHAIEHLSTKASFVAKLLLNEMPDTIDDAFADAGVHLLPSTRDDLATDCSCPDWSNPCKHIAGVYYLLASDLDSDPFLLFELRGLPRKTLLKQLAASPLGRILAESAAPAELPIEEASSLFTVPTQAPAAAATLKQFWQGPKRLPAFEPATPPSVPALLIKKGGDYPAFWHKGTSFIETMEVMYERVRTKSLEL